MTRRSLFALLAGLPVVKRLVATSKPEPAPDLIFNTMQSVLDDFERQHGALLAAETGGFSQYGALSEAPDKAKPGETVFLSRDGARL